MQNGDTTEAAKASYEITKDLTENQIIFGGNYFDFLPTSPCWLVWDKENGKTDFADCELAYISFKSAVRLYKWTWHGFVRKGTHKEEGKTRIHPTQKPVGLLKQILLDYSNENAKILDCFGGSGSTLIACEATNRQCFMMETDKFYIDKIIDRYQQFTGKKAVKICEEKD